MKKNQQHQNNRNFTLFILAGSIIIIWLISLTVFSIAAWRQHMWQAEVDNEAIYNLGVENANQQSVLDGLK